MFENGFLDQGFWPEGIYTAPSDEALKYDLVMLRQFGFGDVLDYHCYGHAGPVAD